MYCDGRGWACQPVLDATGNEQLAAVLGWLSEKPLKIGAILLVAWVANRLLRRIISHTGRADGRQRGSLRRLHAVPPARRGIGPLRGPHGHAVVDLPQHRDRRRGHGRDRLDPQRAGREPRGAVRQRRCGRRGARVRRPEPGAGRAGGVVHPRRGPLRRGRHDRRRAARGRRRRTRHLALHPPARRQRHRVARRQRRDPAGRQQEPELVPRRGRRRGQPVGGRRQGVRRCWPRSATGWSRTPNGRNG